MVMLGGLHGIAKGKEEKEKEKLPHCYIFNVELQ